MPEPETNEIPPPPAALASSSIMRWWFFTIGWIMVASGVIGIVIPGLPTTVFLIIAAWAFSRSSVRFQMWLWNHRILGPSVRNWHQHRVIPLRGKILAVTTMVASIVYMLVLKNGEWMMPLLMIVVLFPIGLYICTRAGKPPQATDKLSEPVDDW